MVAVLVHADFLNLSVDNDAKTDDGLSEEEMYKCIVNYLNYANIDSDPAESWNLRREAHKSFARLKTSTEYAIRRTGAVGGVVGKFFASAAPKGSLKEVGEKLTKDLLGAGYGLEKTATTLFTTAAGGVANIPSTVRRDKPHTFTYLSRPDPVVSLYKSSTGSSETRTLSTGLLSRILRAKIRRKPLKP